MKSDVGKEKSVGGGGGEIGLVARARGGGGEGREKRGVVWKLEEDGVEVEPVGESEMLKNTSLCRQAVPLCARTESV